MAARHDILPRKLVLYYLRMPSVIPYNAHRAWLVVMGKRKHQDEESDEDEGTVVKKQKAELVVVDEETPRLSDFM